MRTTRLKLKYRKNTSNKSPLFDNSTIASNIKSNEAKRDALKLNLLCYARLVSRQQNMVGEN